ncbi:sigma-70 family RNA polymerase sigma factor [Catenulispora sp. NF23]|uniref:sigma-70 family RNA polymerase sigma factor n=1 Tax=Catenulispora pinistramenti TaxID=2705254 RepID=UPI001BA8027E|nr:sigma-70 family RNA polymerase sigma factor [Catenulispora pinistramenti]MBS2539044.1 sigma-70 family RNA polymerase sigma factor [Catenulispora pinistramenti]
MDDRDQLAERFEAHRGHLRGVAFRMLGSLSDAEDAVQEAWVRLDRTGADQLENLLGWLTTVVGRICLDMLRSRKARREIGGHDDTVAAIPDERTAEPEQETLLVESVGRAMLVVLDRLSPAERVAFVLHDMFSVPFDEIAAIVNRTPVAAKKLASRARLRVTDASASSAGHVDLAWHRQVVESFLAAARGRDLAGLLAVLDPGVVRHADAAGLPPGVPLEVTGANAVVEETLLLTRNARFADVVLVNGGMGLVVAPRGRLLLALTFDIKDGRIIEYSVIGDPQRLAHLHFALPPR